MWNANTNQLLLEKLSRETCKTTKSPSIVFYSEQAELRPQ